MLVRHGAFFPMIDKVRRIRNSVEHRSGRSIRSIRIEKVHAQATRSIGMVEMAVRTAGAEESWRRQREAESGLGRQETPQRQEEVAEPSQ